MTNVKSIIVVGGGSAGWMSAAYLSTLPGVKVTLIESDRIPTIGVGESTIPGFIDFLKDIGLAEQTILDHCSGVRKYGIQHNNWAGSDDVWWHMFGDNQQDIYEQFCLMESGTVPTQRHRYSYHLDATQFASVIKNYSNHNVNHCIDTLNQVETSGGKVVALHGTKATYTADFFVDCSGWPSIVRSSLGSEYQSHKSLANNFSLCGPGEYLPGEDPLPYTQTYAMDYGWRWRVSLQHRTGNGYAFNRDLISIEDARQEFIAKTPGLQVDKIFEVPILNRYNQEPWKQNVLALGLSCGFLEPLEATGLFLVHGPVKLLARLMNDPRAAEKYNRVWNSLYKNCAEFLSMFFQGSGCNHTAYWQSFDKISSVQIPTLKQPLFNRYNYECLADGMNLKPIL